MSAISIIPWIFSIWLIWQPIIINSQPGTQFWYAGIDWKADNLDNTMFWLGILFICVSGASDVNEYKDKQKERREQNSYI